MNLFGLNIKISRRSAPDPGVPLSQAALGWLRGDDTNTAGASLSNAYQQVVWVYRAINVLAEQVANIPFLFSRGERGRKKLITSGPLLDFYSRPHSHINRFQYWELRIIWLMLRGECMRIPIFQDSASHLSTFNAQHSKLKTVLILDPAHFQHIIDQHQLIGWRYTGFAQNTPLESQVFLPEEVWFEKLPNPFDFWRGLPPLSSATRPAFGAVAMSAPLEEKSPTLSFASLESHKIGGIVRLPREIDEQSIVSLGRFLARYGTIEFARAEDTFAFLADGSTTYDGIRGIVQVAIDNNSTSSLPAGKVKPSDATLDDFRSLRTKVNKAALNGRLSAYYLDTTWETRLPSFKTAAEPTVYQRLPNGTAILDGYPIVWTDVLEPYGTGASAEKPIAVFGALSFWWFGEHGQPRIDTSDQVWFANDQLAVRFIEEIDFDYCAADATAALLTAAE